MLTAIGGQVHPDFELKRVQLYCARGPSYPASRSPFRNRGWDRSAGANGGLRASYPSQHHRSHLDREANTIVHSSLSKRHGRKNPKMVQVLPQSGIAVLNGDDPNILWMKSRTMCARIITFGVLMRRTTYARVT